ncbi:MAG: carboxypeptidase-like regulatory domain-containing protein [Desulfococcaceae bacterium]
MKKKQNIITAVFFFLLIVHAHEAWCNQPPSSFNLLAPLNGSSHFPTLVLDWQTATDPDAGDKVTYDLYVSDNDQFLDEINGEPRFNFYEEGLSNSAFALNETHGIVKLKTYFWKVIAYDDYGNTQQSSVWTFHTLDPEGNPADVTVEGNVSDADTGFPIPSAEILYGSNQITADDVGYYLKVIEYKENYLVTVSATGYISREFAISNVQEGDLFPYDFSLISDNRGNISGTDGVSLADAILGLKILSGISTAPEVIHMNADVNNDERIGIAEVIYVLQLTAKLRQ